MYAVAERTREIGLRIALVFIAFVACLIPARRALAVDPARTLRQ